MHRRKCRTHNWQLSQFEIAGQTVRAVWECSRCIGYIVHTRTFRRPAATVKVAGEVL